MTEDKEKRVAIVVGARPNFVKAAPLFARLTEYPRITPTLIHTGQHYDHNMSEIFFMQMGMPEPHIRLAIDASTTSERLGKMISELTACFASNHFDAVIVFGDIDSSFAASISAVKTGTRLVHIEAGLRSHDRRMPEERNRIAIDHMSDLLFISDPDAITNLEREGVSSEKIISAGNIMIESLERFSKYLTPATTLSALNLTSKEYVVVTVHRSENTEDPKILARILDTLATLSEHRTLVFPLHPGTKEKIKNLGLFDRLSRVRVIEPLGYFEFIALVRESSGVITDSGGVQEETTHMCVACATIRDNTERPVTLTHGTNKLFSMETLDSNAINDHLDREMVTQPIPGWDGDVSKRICDVLDRWL